MSVSPPEQSSSPVPPSPPETPPHRILDDPASESPPSETTFQPPSPATGPSHADSTNYNGSGWFFPTSGDLAYLASLPRPTLCLRAETQSSELVTSDSSPAKDANADANAETGSSAAEAIPLTGSDFLLAISRYRSAIKEGREFRRRDTWTLGEGWGRHVRVIDAGEVDTAGGERKESC